MRITNKSWEQILKVMKRVGWDYSHNIVATGFARLYFFHPNGHTLPIRFTIEGVTIEEYLSYSVWQKYKDLIFDLENVLEWERDDG